MCEQMMGGGILSAEKKKNWPSKGKEPHGGVVGQGKFHTHGRFFPTYFVQLGTDNEQQWIDISNSRGRVLVYAFHLP
jgi:hypothetical protein